MSPNLMSLVFSAVMTMAGLIIIGAIIAVVVAGAAMLLAVGSGAAAAWKAWRASRAQASRYSTASAEPTPDWSDDDLALASLSDLARRSNRPTCSTVAARATLTADELVLELLNELRVRHAPAWEHSSSV